MNYSLLFSSAAFSSFSVGILAYFWRLLRFYVLFLFGYGVIYDGWKITSPGSGYLNQVGPSRTKEEGNGLLGFVRFSGRGLSHVLSIVYIWGDEKSPAFNFHASAFYRAL